MTLPDVGLGRGAGQGAPEPVRQGLHVLQMSGRPEASQAALRVASGTAIPSFAAQAAPQTRLETRRRRHAATLPALEACSIRPAHSAAGSMAPKDQKRKAEAADSTEPAKRTRTVLGKAASVPSTPAAKTPGAARARGQRGGGGAGGGASAGAGAGAGAGVSQLRTRPERGATPPDVVVAWILRAAEAVRKDGYPEAAERMRLCIEAYPELMAAKVNRVLWS